MEQATKKLAKSLQDSTNKANKAKGKVAGFGATKQSSGPSVQNTPALRKQKFKTFANV